MLRTKTNAAVLAVLAGLLLTPAAAYAQSQAVSFNVGFFIPKGESTRANDDVLIAELNSSDPLLFEVSDFRGGNFGAEWLVGLGDYLDAGFGASYYSRTVPSIYEFSVRESGQEIEQELRLRIAPIAITLRVYPAGKFHGFQPYIGGGLAWLKWHYSEIGDFIDPTDDSIFPARYIADGTATGGVFLGGVRYPFGKLLVGGEARYHTGKADLPTGGFEGFIAPKIDLGGWTGNFTLGVRF